VGILFFPVAHPKYPHQLLGLVVARPKQRPAWHFLTSEPITSPDDAWQLLRAYARRWQMETEDRFFKAELALENPRLWSWHNRLKLFTIVALVYAFRSPSSLRLQPRSKRFYSSISAPEPASGTVLPRCRSTVFGLRLFAFGSLIPFPLSPFGKIRDEPC
jgi:hypothetical protein